MKKDQHKQKNETKKTNEKVRSVTVVFGDSIVKKVKELKVIESYLSTMVYLL